MEEKLYFKPASYGKGIRKKEQKSAKSDDENRPRRTRNLILLILFLVTVVLIILWLLRGKTTTTGQYPENLKNESLVCMAANITPPKIDSIDSHDKEIKINIVFNGTEEMKRIYFTYTLIYGDEDEAYGNEAKSHAFFNKALAASGYQVDKFDNKFSRYNNKLSISLSAERNDIDEYSASYFMIVAQDNEVLKDQNLDWFKKNYETQGFVCESSI